MHRLAVSFHRQANVFVVGLSRGTQRGFPKHDVVSMGVDISAWVLCTSFWFATSKSLTFKLDFETMSY
jgi:hypothetical protein